MERTYWDLRREANGSKIVKYRKIPEPSRHAFSDVLGLEISFKSLMINDMSQKRSASPSVEAPDPKRPPTLHAWLHPTAPPSLITHSPPLHASSSTFLSFSVSFLPGSHVTSEATLTKEAKRVIRELDAVSLIGDEAMSANERAFQDGEGRAPGRKGKERAREPDHRMWAVRTLCLKEGKDGTGGEDDYQVSD